jgi:hypothetical protein
MPERIFILTNLNLTSKQLFLVNWSTSTQAMRACVLVCYGRDHLARGGDEVKMKAAVLRN